MPFLQSVLQLLPFPDIPVWIAQSEITSKWGRTSWTNLLGILALHTIPVFGELSPSSTGIAGAPFNCTKVSVCIVSCVGKILSSQAHRGVLAVDGSMSALDIVGLGIDTANTST